MSVTATTLPDAGRSLAAAMRAGSREEHDAAEHSPFVSELFDGKINRQGYIDYLLRLRMVYAALEDAMRAGSGDPRVAAIYDPALDRLPAIDADLDHWAPGASREIDSPAAQAYCERIAAAGPAELVAHHYTRYLGDLSGGQAIGRLLDRHFGLDGVGLSFYNFFPLRPKPYKDAYRLRLDGLDLADDEFVALIDEVKHAFRLNQSVFEELGRRLETYRA